MSKRIRKTGENLFVPYYIEKEDIEHATNIVWYTDDISLDDIAEQYSTTADSLIALNEEAVQDGKVISSTLIVPSFSSQTEIAEKKSSQQKIYMYQ